MNKGFRKEYKKNLINTYKLYIAISALAFSVMAALTGDFSLYLKLAKNVLVTAPVYIVVYFIVCKLVELFEKKRSADI